MIKNAIHNKSLDTVAMQINSNYYNIVFHGSLFIKKFIQLIRLHIVLTNVYTRSIRNFSFTIIYNSKVYGFCLEFKTRTFLKIYFR